MDALFVAEGVIVELDSWPFHGDKIAFETDRVAARLAGQPVGSRVS